MPGSYLDDDHGKRKGVAEGRGDETLPASGGGRG